MELSTVEAQLLGPRSRMEIIQISEADCKEVLLEIQAIQRRLRQAVQFQVLDNSRASTS